MEFEYDRFELMQSLGEALSQFFFKDLPEGVPAEELRARGRALGAVLGRVQAVIAEEGGIGPETIMEIRRLESLHSKRMADQASESIRPGGYVWSRPIRE